MSNLLDQIMAMERDLRSRTNATLQRIVTSHSFPRGHVLQLSTRTWAMNTIDERNMERELATSDGPVEGMFPTRIMGVPIEELDVARLCKIDPEAFKSLVKISIVHGTLA